MYLLILNVCGQCVCGYFITIIQIDVNDVSLHIESSRVI